MARTIIKVMLSQSMDGTIWAEVDDNNLGRGFVEAYRNGAWTAAKPDIVCVSDDRPKIVGFTKDGSAWFSCAGGLSRFSAGTFAVSSAQLRIRSLLQTKDDTIWACHFGGLSRLDNNKWISVANTELRSCSSIDDARIIGFPAKSSTRSTRTTVGIYGRNGSTDLLLPSDFKVNSPVALIGLNDDLWLAGEYAIGHFVASRGRLTIRTGATDSRILGFAIKVESGWTDAGQWQLRYAFADKGRQLGKTQSTQFKPGGSVEVIIPEGLDQSIQILAEAGDPDGSKLLLDGPKYLSDARYVSPPTIAQPVITSPTEAPALEISGLPLDVTGAAILIDGVRVQGLTVDTRDKAGVRLSPPKDLIQRLRTGFHDLIIEPATSGLNKQAIRFTFYKEEFTLKLFRPFRRSFAVVIAISDYPKESGYRRLPSAVPQAKQVEAYLSSQGFTVKHFYNDEATRGAIDDYLLNEMKATPEDRVLVYFGGHGDDAKDFYRNPIGFLVPFDGKASRLSTTGITLQDLRERYATLILAKQVLFVLDSCQSGLVLKRGDADFALTPDQLRRFKALTDIDSYSREPGRMVLTAGTGGESALDISGGIFTSAFLDGIKGKADLFGNGDGNGVVDFYELYNYIRGRVQIEAATKGFKQTPDLGSFPLMGDGKFVFVTDATLLK